MSSHQRTQKETQKKADFITVISEVEDEEADEINPLEMVWTTDCPIFRPKEIESRTREEGHSCESGITHAKKSKRRQSFRRKIGKNKFRIFEQNDSRKEIE